MKEWFLSLAFRWGFSWAISYTGGWLRKDRAFLAALTKLNGGGTFLEITRSYAAVTPGMTDDRIVEGIEQLKRDLTVVPFNRLVRENEILVMMGQIKIPDFDGDPTNDKEVSNLLGEIMDKTLSVESEQED